MSDAAWIAVDWGTSHLRAWLMDAADRVLERRESDAGMASLAPAAFPGALQALIGRFDGPVIACGMVGSRQGWAEAPYATVPCKPPSAREATRVGQVHILPGLKQVEPADVMRGEETQIVGFLEQNPGFDGVLCLPGTHTKWVQVSAGEVVSFRTAMTGEIFALMSEHSVLRHSMGTGWEAEAFDLAVADGMARPDMLAARFFNIRAEGLLRGQTGNVARARLSGLLVGAELTSMRAYWLGQALAIIGAPELSELYARALSAQGLQPQIADGEAQTLAGLVAARTALEVT